MAKCLSVKEPWAELIASGQKTIEIRSRRTNYRGKLYIHASLKPKTKNSGMVIAVCELDYCQESRPYDSDAAKCLVGYADFSWFLSDIKRIKPFPVTGQLGIYNIDLPEGME